MSLFSVPFGGVVGIFESFIMLCCELVFYNFNISSLPRSFAISTLASMFKSKQRKELEC